MILHDYLESVLGRIGRIITKDEEKKRQKKAGGYQIRSISDLESAIFENWLKRDFREKNDTSNLETTILRRQFPNNIIVIGELPTIGESQEPMREISVMAIAHNPAYDNDEWEDIPEPVTPVLAISFDTPQLKAGDRMKYIGNRFQSIYGGDHILTITTVNGFEFTCERPDTGTFTTWIKSNELAIA